MHDQSGVSVLLTGGHRILNDVIQPFTILVGTPS
jgi:hypothetical protein